MKAIRVPILALALLSAAVPSVAKDRPAANPDKAAATKLLAALQQMVAPLTAPPRTARLTEQSQGALHASPRAIDEVCNHDNPSAERAAICRPISPD